MKQNKEIKIITIENFFSNNLAKNNIFIPYFEVIKNLQTVIYTDNYNQKSLMNYLNKFNYSKNTIVSFYDYQNKKSNNIVSIDKNKIKKYIEIWNLAKKEDFFSKNKNILLFLSNKVLKLLNNTENEKLENFFSFNKVKNNILKNQFCQVCHEFIGPLTNIFKDIKLKYKEFNSSIKNLENNFDYKLHLYNFWNTLISANEELVKTYFKLYEKIESLIESYTSENNIFLLKEQQKEVNKNKRKKEYLEYLQNNSPESLQNKINIKTKEYDLDFYSKYKDDILISNYKYINFIKEKIKKEIAVLKIKRKLLLLKNREEILNIKIEILIKKKIIKTFSYYKNKLNYLFESELASLHKQLNNEGNIFAAKNLIEKDKKHKKQESLFYLNRLINYEFVLDINEYLEISENRKIQINEKLKNLEKDITNLKNKIFSKYFPDNFKISRHNLEQDEEKTKAELQWLKDQNEKIATKLNANKQKDFDEFLRYFRYTEKVLGVEKHIFENTSKKYNLFLDSKEKEFEKYIKEFNNNFFSLFFVKELNNLFHNLKFPGFKITKDKLNIFFTTFKLNKLIKNNNFEYKDLIDVFNSSNEDFLIKTKFLTSYIEGKKIIFIDLLEFSPEMNWNLYIEKIQSYSELFKINTVLITSNLDILKNFGDQIHFFINNSFLEGGDKNEIFRRPINPIVKEILKGSNHKFEMLTNYKSWSANKMIDISTTKKHYIFSTITDFQKWTHQIVEHEDNSLKSFRKNKPENIKASSKEQLNIPSIFNDKTILLPKVKTNILNLEEPSEMVKELQEDLQSEMFFVEDELENNS